MGGSTSSITAAIGARVRSARQARGWTLDHLAEAADISRRQLVNVERGDANPSVSTLLAMSDALGMSLSDLVAAPSTRLVTITRAGDGAHLWTGEHGGYGVLLSSTPPPDVVELWEWQLAPQDRHDSTAHRKGTRELLHVHAGVVTLEIAEDSYDLTAGDAITFPGDVAHAYANQGTDRARFSLAVYEPQAPSPRGKVRADD